MDQQPETNLEGVTSGGTPPSGTLTGDSISDNQHETLEKARLNVGGLFALVLFYFLIFMVGMYAGYQGKKNRRKLSQDGTVAKSPSSPSINVDAEVDYFASSSAAPNDVTTGIPGVTTPQGVELSGDEDYILAGRNIGWLVGTFTMTATWVGGGYINGTAEALYNPELGLIWAQAPWGYALSLVIGGFGFASVMRGEGFITMIDPFQKKYGDLMGVLLFLPALLAETLWSAAILAALGSSVTVMMDLSNEVSIISSAVVVMLYTVFGGLYSVAYTDVIQLFLICIGLWLVVPFALSHEEVRPLSSTSNVWVGKWSPEKMGQWFDLLALLVLGGIPWQVYFQRVLSAKSAKRSVGLSLLASVGCIFMALPAGIIGCVGASVKDWSKFEKGGSPLEKGEGKNILPLVINNLTPSFVSWVGLGAVSAAVMSSADSSLLSASSMFTRNVYKVVIRPEAKEKEMKRALKVSVLSVGTLAMVFALCINSIFDLWVMCSDFVYVILFPQLLSVIYITQTNSYGSLLGYFVGLVLRVSGGIKVFGIPALLKFPYFDSKTGEQRFPFRSLSMILSLATIVAVSYSAKFLFETKKLSYRYDVFHCFHPKPNSDSSKSGKIEGVTGEYNNGQQKMGAENNGVTLGVSSGVSSSTSPPPASSSSYREPRSYRQCTTSLC